MLKIARYLKTKGLNTSVLSISEKETGYSIDGIEFVFFRKGRLPNFSCSLLRYLLTSNSDRFVFVGSTSVAMLLPWLRFKKMILIPQWHHSYLFKNKFSSLLYHIYRFLFDYSLTCIAQPDVVCYTETEYSHIRKFAKNVTRVPLGLDFDRSLWKVYDKLGPAQKTNCPNLLFVGRVVDHKFPIFVLEVIRRCMKKFENSFVFNVVGPIDQAYFSELRKRLENTSFGDRIIFTGQISEAELARYYRDADVFVFPSFSESFGYSIVEALYAGLPVVATRTGIVPYLEKQGLVSGVTYGDAEDMANKILDSVRNSDVIKRKLVERRMFLTKEFDMNNFLESLFNIVS